MFQAALASTKFLLFRNFLHSNPYIRNIGIAFTRTDLAGVQIVNLTTTGTNVGGGTSVTYILGSGCNWKLSQQSVDSTEEPPLFGVSSCEKTSIYRLTVTATKIYQNDSLNFYDYTTDVGRNHFMILQPGLCSQPLASADYSYAHMAYVNLETLVVDFCNLEVPMAASNPDTAACGNGILDLPEDCDDGNTRSGDGCSSTCTVEPGWRCYNYPYATRCKIISIIVFSSMREK